MDEMPEETAREICRNARYGMPLEVCGFVLVGWELQNCRNVAKFPRRAFKFEDKVVLEMLLTRRDEILGMYHTHPSGRPMPSMEDQGLMLQRPDFRHWIATATDVYEWRMTDDGARSVRRDGSTGIEGMAYPVLEAAEALRRTG